MTLRSGTPPSPAAALAIQVSHRVPIADRDAPPALAEAPSMEQRVRAWHDAGHSQRGIARELGIDRRKSYAPSTTPADVVPDPRWQAQAPGHATTSPDQDVRLAI
jgi:hypothetical protein